MREGSCGAATGDGCTGDSGGMLVGSGRREIGNWGELQGPGRRSRKGGREKQNWLESKVSEHSGKVLLREMTESPFAQYCGITTQMARTFLRGVQDLVGSCRQQAIVRRCSFSALMSSAARLHAQRNVQVMEGAWPRLLPQLPQHTRLNMPIATIRAILKKFKKTGTVTNLPGSGPMFILAPSKMRMMRCKKFPKDHSWIITKESSIFESSSIKNYN